MAWQLIYTSAPRGLVPGRSGFCTVARHREIRDGLVTAIERFSQYDRGGRTAGAQSPVVYAHRIVRLGGASFHVLSCTADAGADYTGRTNHLAHHLICEPHELAQAPSPAEILRQMAWRRSWTEAPRHLGAEDAIDLRGFQRTASLPAQSWQRLTGDAGCAALPLESGALSGSFWLCPEEAGEQYLLPFFAETLLLLEASGHGGEKLWQVPFTTYLQSTDQAADFFWRGCWHGSPAALAAQGTRQTLDFSQPHTLQAPAGKAADLARHGWPAAPESAPPAPPAAVTPVPAPRGDTRGQEFDLSSLLAGADENASGGRVWRKEEVGRPYIRHAVPGSAGKRRPPLKLFIGAGAAVILIGALALGFLLWRDGKAERISGELRQARSAGDFARGKQWIAAASGVLRGYEPLAVEIERMQVAAELDALKSKAPGSAGDYLVSNRARLNSVTIQNDFQLADRLKKIEAWSRAGDKAGKLAERIQAATFRDPVADNALKGELAGLEKEIAKLDAPYRATISNSLAESRRLYVRRRFEAIEQMVREGGANRELALVELLQDADRFAAGPEVKERITRLYQPPAAMPAAARSEPHGEPSESTRAAAKSEARKAPGGLPAITTYLALSSPAGFDISAITEMQGGATIPTEGTWYLTRNPAPALDPQGAKTEACNIINGKIYDGGSVELITPQKGQMVMSAQAKASVRDNFLLRFTPKSGDGKAFQIFFQQAAGNVAPLVGLPRAAMLVWDQKLAHLALSPELSAGLQRIRLAAAGEPALFLRAARWGEHELKISQAAPGPLDLGPILTAVALEVDRRKTAAMPPKASSLEERARAATTARDRLMGKDDKTGLSKAGAELFGEKDDSLATTDSYINSVKGLPKDTMKNGRTYVEYTYELFKRLAERVDREMRDLEDEFGKLDTTKPNQRERKNHLGKVRRNLAEQKAAVDGILARFDAELKLPGFSRQRSENIIKIWTNYMASLADFKRDPAKHFHAKWTGIFTPANIESVRPFFEWNADGTDGDLDQALASLPEKKAPAVPAEDPLETMLQLLKTNLPSLGPFFIDLQTSGGKAIRLVSFTETPGADVGDTVKAAP